MLASASVVSSKGEGTYGKVVVVKVPSGHRYAIKTSKCECDNEDGIAEDVLREWFALSTLGQCHHAVVRCFALEAFNIHKYAFVMESFPHDLNHAIRHKMLTKKAGRGVVAQIADALSYCHERGIVHRDVSHRNILVDPDTEKAVLADFGTCVLKYVEGRTMSMAVTTLWFRAPEVLMGDRKYGPAVDVWSLGCVLLSMNAREFPLTGNSDFDQLRRIVLWCGRPSKAMLPRLSTWTPEIHVDKEATDVFPKSRRHLHEVVDDDDSLSLVKMMLVVDPAVRALPSDVATQARMTLHESKTVFVRKRRRELASSSSRLPKRWSLNYDLTLKMRNILVEWMIEVACKVDVSTIGLHRSVALVDRYVEKHAVGRSQLQCVAVASFILCSKLFDNTSMCYEFCVRICDHAFSFDDLHCMEKTLFDFVTHDTTWLHMTTVAEACEAMRAAQKIRCDWQRALLFGNVSLQLYHHPTDVNDLAKSCTALAASCPHTSFGMWKAHLLSAHADIARINPKLSKMMSDRSNEDAERRDVV